MAVGASGTTIYSDNGTSWTANTALTNTPNLLAVAASGSSFAAVGASVTPNYNLFFSADGISWSGFFRDPAAAWNGITYPTSGDGYFLAVGGTSFWNPATSSQDYTGYAIERGTASGNEWLNRYTMPQLAAGNSMALNAAAWNASNVIVAVGINGIARSTNGTSWAAATKPVTYPLNDIVWGRSLFIAVGVGGGITTSPDGITWTTSTSGTTKTLKGVACSPTWCIAVGDGVALTSTDGITWVLQSNLPTDSGFVDVVWGGSQFIAVGTGGKIWRITSQ